MSVRWVNGPRTRGADAGSDVSARPRRADIDGLRVLAVGLVVVYHVWFDRVSGGVDVFLLVSAYLLTESLVRRISDGRRISVGSYWLRRFAQLLPAAAVTIAAVLAFTALARPPSAWGTVWEQAWSSLLFAQNWTLAAATTDYYARDAGVSPLLNFWSLSVQAQIFVLWPVLLVAGAALARRLGRSPRAVLAVAFGVVFAGSLAYAATMTAMAPGVVYFDTAARLWEFALGSLAALAAPFLRLRPLTARILGAVGLAGLVGCGMVLDAEAGFPGFAALWPTLCAVAILWAGTAVSPGRVTRLLSAPALAGAGRYAYPLYLVHWPILVGFLVLTGSDVAGPVGGAVVIGMSIAAAILLARIVDLPVRAALRTTGSTVAVVAAAAGLVVVPLTAWQAGERAATSLAVAEGHPGAASLRDAALATDLVSRPIPYGQYLSEEWVSLGDACEGRFAPTTDTLAATCQQRGGSDGAPSVVVVGNSHAEQWAGAFLPLADERDWTLVGLYKGGCILGDDPGPDAEPEGCREWIEEAAAYAEAVAPDVVVMIGTRAVPDALDEHVAPGFDAVVDRFAAHGSQVVLLRDNPRFLTDVFACVEEAGDRARDCDRPADEVLAPTNPAEIAFGGRPGVHVVDLTTSALCPDGICRAVIGNVVVYLDDNHLTGAYSRTMAPFLSDALAGVPALAPRPAAV